MYTGSPKICIDHRVDHARVAGEPGEGMAVHVRGEIGAHRIAALLAHVLRPVLGVETRDLVEQDPISSGVNRLGKKRYRRGRTPRSAEMRAPWRPPFLAAPSCRARNLDDEAAGAEPDGQGISRVDDGGRPVLFHRCRAVDPMARAQPGALEHAVLNGFLGEHRVNLPRLEGRGAARGGLEGGQARVLEAGTSRRGEG